MIVLDEKRPSVRSLIRIYFLDFLWTHYNFPSFLRLLVESIHNTVTGILLFIIVLLNDFLGPIQYYVLGGGEDFFTG